MIVEQRKILTWTWFADRAFTALNRVFLFTADTGNVLGMKRVTQLDMEVDISLPEDKLLDTYQSRTKKYITAASKKYDFTLENTTDPKAFLGLFNQNAEAIGLFQYNERFFATKKDYLIRNLYEDQKLLSTHLYLLDHEKKIVICTDHASAFRFYPAEKRKISTANKYLFHRSFVYFGQRGFEKYYAGGYEMPEGQEAEIEGIKTFKNGFNGKIVKRWHYYPLWYYYFQQLRRKL